MNMQVFLDPCSGSPTKINTHIESVRAGYLTQQGATSADHMHQIQHLEIRQVV